MPLVGEDCERARLARLDRAEAGLKAALPSVWWGLYAPKGTPQPIVKRLETEMARILADADMKERMARISVLPFYRDQGAMRAFMKQDSELNAELIRSTKMTLE